jgi:dipeptide/tripeptide permease
LNRRLVLPVAGWLGMNGSPQRFPLTMWVGFGLLFGLLGLMYLISLLEFTQARQKTLPVIDQVADFAPI